MKMSSFDFINHFDDLLDDLSSVIRPEYSFLIDRMRKEDPHDLITPEMEFESRTDAIIHI
jgi:hypothetical protein